jgi:adenylate cyclase
MAGAVAWVVFRRGAKWGAFAGLLLIGLEIIVAWVLFDRSQVVVPIISPALAVIFSFLGSTSYVSIVEGREKRMIRGAVGKYVAAAVVDELMADPARLKLGGDRRHISILFSDLAGFTSMSETLDPEKLVAVLNRYLDEMSDIVIDEKGTVDKFIGDAIMALYGAPNALPQHAVHACRTAVRMQERLADLNRSWNEADPNWPWLKVRIGVNTGKPVVGNIGGSERFDYTALGDSVNLAARLEPACKVYGVGIMIAEQTREEAGDAIVVRELDLLAVYGKKEPIRVFEVLAMAGSDLGPSKREALEQYEKGLQLFRQRDFELALQYFRAALESDPTDGPAALYMERCEEYTVSPPPADWDFVERRQVK